MPCLRAMITGCMVVDKNGERNPDAEGYLPTFSGGEYTAAEFNEYLLPGQTATVMYRHKTLNDLMMLLKSDSKSRPRLPVIDRFLVLGVLHFGRIYTDSEKLAAYRFVLDSGSGSWSSKNNGYTFRNLFLFLFGLHEFERIGRHLGLDIDFDKRRRFEYRKLSSEKDSFPKRYVPFVKMLILLWYRDKKQFPRIFRKKVRKRIRRMFS